MAGFENDIGYAANFDFTQTDNQAPSESNGLATDGQLWIGTTAVNAGGTHINVGTLTSPNSSISIGFATPNITLQTGAAVATTYTANSGSATPAANNLNVLGNNNADNGFATWTTGSGSTLNSISHGTAKWIVHPTSGIGTHTTIASALTSAVSGETIFITPGTYTENLTLKAGVNLVAYMGDEQTPNVTIAGTATFTAAGTVTISNIRLQTNSAFLLAVTGSAASIVNLENCYLNCTNNTGISFTTSSSSALIFLKNCISNLGTTGIAYFASSSAGTLNYNFCTSTNTGGSTTASTISAGALLGLDSTFKAPITSSGTAGVSLNACQNDTSAQNATPLTIGGSGANRIGLGILVSGSAAAISISQSCTMAQCEINSSNANPVTGAGTLNYTPFAFSGTGQGVNVTTRNPLNYGTWTPTLTGSAVAGTTTYTTQAGYYTIVGNAVLLEGIIVITAATGTGNAVIGNFPFTVKNLSNYAPVGSISLASAAWTWTGAGTQLHLKPNANTTNAVIDSLASTAAANLAMTNGAATFTFSVWYQI